MWRHRSTTCRAMQGCERCHDHSGPVPLRLPAPPFGATRMNASSNDHGRPSAAIEVRFPDIERWASGNTGIPYVWSYAAEAPGPHTLVQALTHGNEVCGAIALD